jgi:hypothetical protein
LKCVGAIEAQLGEIRGTACNDAAVEAVADATTISTTRSEITAEDSTSPQLPVCRHENSLSQHDDVKSSTVVKTPHEIDEQEIERFLHKIVRPGTVFDRVVCDGELSGWTHLSLNIGSMEAMQAHPGIKAIEVEHLHSIQHSWPHLFFSCLTIY